MVRAKIVSSPDEAVREITEGSTVMFGGFGGAGAPDRLIDALADFGVGFPTSRPYPENNLKTMRH